MESIEKKLNKVFIIRYLIEINWFSEDQITELCCWLGFCDTSFREKDAKGKLNDFLLDPAYWLKRNKKLIRE